MTADVFSEKQAGKTDKDQREDRTKGTRENVRERDRERGLETDGENEIGERPSDKGR